MLAPTLALAILAAYAGSLWWLLRREAASSLIWVVGLTGLSAGLRLVYTTELPAGMNEDETKILWCAIEMLKAGRIFADDCTGIPALLSVVFDAQLATWIGPSRWAIRGLSFLGATLAVPAAFAAARSLGLRIAPALAAAGFVAVLPWALFYGRVHQSGELVFETLLVAACLARFLRARGGWQEILIGGMALTLLLQTYYSGRAMLGLALVATVIAPGRHRLACAGIALIALLGYVPYYRSGATFALVGVSGKFVQAELAEDPWATLRHKSAQAYEALLAPVAHDQWLTIRAAAMHPWWILALAALGTLSGGVRRFLFLWAGILGGMAPAIVGYSPLPSARRMLLGFPFLALAAACALDVAPWKRVRVPLCAAVFAVTAIYSVRLFFSTDFWHPSSAWVFDATRWNLAESLPAPPHPRLIATYDFTYYLAPRAALYKDYQVLDADNWFPANGEEVIYAFGPSFAALQPLYLSLFGTQRVRSFGRAFTVQLEEGDWSWLRNFGWTYRVECGEVRRTSRVPFLYGQGVQMTGQPCPTTPLHVWRARWNGPAASLRLLANGAPTVEVDGQLAGEDPGGRDTRVDFDVRPESLVTIRVRPIYGLDHVAKLTRVTPLPEEQAPLLEWLTPEPLDE